MKGDRFLGIDGGGTKTSAVVLDGDGVETARATSGPSNYYSAGRAVAEESLHEVIHAVLSLAGLRSTDIKSIGLGIAGVDRPGDRAFAQAAVSRAAQFPRIVIVTDAEAALVGGVGCRYGVVLIAGTGAIAFGVNARGEARRCDGWGYLMGDEGSAHWIGVQALRAVVRAHDGRGPATALTDCLFSYLDLHDANGLVQAVYADDFGVPNMAKLARLVNETARDGDVVAQQILREAGKRLSQTLAAVVQGLGMPGEAFEVVLSGGVLRASGLVRECVIGQLVEIAPRAQAIEPRHDAAVGAALLAQLTGE